jgi:hypothetical protein
MIGVKMSSSRKRDMDKLRKELVTKLRNYCALDKQYRAIQKAPQEKPEYLIPIQSPDQTLIEVKRYPLLRLKRLNEQYHIYFQQLATEIKNALKNHYQIIIIFFDRLCQIVPDPKTKQDYAAYKEYCVAQKQRLLNSNQLVEKLISDLSEWKKYQDEVATQLQICEQDFRQTLRTAGDCTISNLPARFVGNPTTTINTNLQLGNLSPASRTVGAPSKDKKTVDFPAAEFTAFQQTRRSL